MESSLRYPRGAAAVSQEGSLEGESKAPETHLLKCYGTRYFVVYLTKRKSPCRMHSAGEGSTATWVTVPTKTSRLVVSMTVGKRQGWDY